MLVAQQAQVIEDLTAVYESSWVVERHLGMSWTWRRAGPAALAPARSLPQTPAHVGQVINDLVRGAGLEQR
ncbi:MULTISPECIES: hypothetical protein [unclassified Pseudonocardia]|uniref:hypothetical protein n=1 Tax=unclassified Pseudonocardia TaxID=2619320 RepID=UPI000AC87962|nr:MULTISPECIES: hypothetical protein [unclassified Pseudonocardia]